MPYQQQTPIVHYLNTPVLAPTGYEIPTQGDIAPGYDPTIDIDKIRKATKGIGTDEAARRFSGVSVAFWELNVVQK